MAEGVSTPSWLVLGATVHDKSGKEAHITGLSYSENDLKSVRFMTYKRFIKGAEMVLVPVGEDTLPAAEFFRVWQRPPPPREPSTVYDHLMDDP